MYEEKPVMNFIENSLRKINFALKSDLYKLYSYSLTIYSIMSQEKYKENYFYEINPNMNFNIVLLPTIGVNIFLQIKTSSDNLIVTYDNHYYSGNYNGRDYEVEKSYLLNDNKITQEELFIYNKNYEDMIKKCEMKLLKIVEKDSSNMSKTVQTEKEKEIKEKYKKED